MHLLADCKHLQAGQKQTQKLCWCLQHHLMSHLQIHCTAILTPYTQGLGDADLWFANLAFITTTFYSLSTRWREKSLLQAESIAASSLLTTLHYHSPLTDTKQNPHSSFISQIGSSRGWLTRVCKRSFLLSNLDYKVCLRRGEWQDSALQSFPKSQKHWRHNCNYLLLELPAQQQLSPSHGSSEFTVVV